MFLSHSSIHILYTLPLNSLPVSPSNKLSIFKLLPYYPIICVHLSTFTFYIYILSFTLPVIASNYKIIAKKNDCIMSFDGKIIKLV